MNLTINQFDLLIYFMEHSLYVLLGMQLGLIPSISYDSFGKTPKAMREARVLLDECERIGTGDPRFLKNLERVKELQKIWN